MRKTQTSPVCTCSNTRAVFSEASHDFNLYSIQINKWQTGVVTSVEDKNEKHLEMQFPHSNSQKYTLYIQEFFF